MNDEVQTQILIAQQVTNTELGHIRSLLEKQNGRVAKLEERVDDVEDRVTQGEISDVKSKAWLSGVAAGVGAVAAMGVDKVFKFFEKAVT